MNRHDAAMHHPAVGDSSALDRGAAMTRERAAPAYTLSNADEPARARLAALEAVYNQGTFRVLTTLGIGPGWRCLEIGAGGGSVAAWLADRVGSSGQVCATDIDTRFLRGLPAQYPQLEIQEHDIAARVLPKDAFDLVHARLVLEHLPGRTAALRHLVDALAPGGWLVVEAIDFVSEQPDPALNAVDTALFARLHAGRAQFLADRGFDLAFARGLARRLRTLGLIEIETEGRAYTWRGGSAGSRVWRGSLAQLHLQLIEGGYFEAEELRRIELMLDDPGFAATSPMVLAVWGRRKPG